MNAEVKSVINENTEVYLGTTVTSNPSHVNLFFLSLIIDGNFLRNCMIDSRASNNVMPIKIMEEVVSKIDSTYGKCYVMDSRKVLVIGVINKVPYKLEALREKELFTSITVVDIPPTYGMLLSREWSASMGGEYIV